MKIVALITSLFTLVLLSACQQQFDLDAEIAAIQKTAAEHAIASSKDGIEGAEGYASYATDDARWLPPGRPAIRGREAIVEMAMPDVEIKDYQIAWDHSHVVVSRANDFAYSVGTYKGSWKDAEGNAQGGEGKLVNVWHKQADGSWKIAVAIWNGNGAPTVPEESQKQSADE